MSTTYPVVVSTTDNTVTLGFTHEGNEIRLELAKTMIKGQAQWAAKRLAAKGASVPEYNTKERLQWAQQLQTQAGVSQ
jgi:hypothetical protein